MLTEHSSQRSTVVARGNHGQWVAGGSEQRYRMTGHNGQDSRRKGLALKASTSPQSSENQVPSPRQGSWRGRVAGQEMALRAIRLDHSSQSAGIMGANFDSEIPARGRNLRLDPAFLALPGHLHRRSSVFTPPVRLSHKSLQCTSLLCGRRGGGRQPSPTLAYL